MGFDTERICKSIEQALLAEEYEEEKARDIAFHMTDWLNNLEELNDFYRRPDDLSSEKIEELLIGFLCHTPNHLAAAAKLLLGFGVTDVFEVGAIGDEEDTEEQDDDGKDEE